MGYQNFFATKLSTDIGASDTTITLDNAPTVTSGRLVLEARNATQREIIEYTGVSGNDITGVTRGVGGTSATTHIKGALVEMNVTAEDLAEALSVPEDIDERTDEIIGDHVASGLVWTDDTGLNADMSAGVAYINGIRLAVDAVADHTFTASVDTYIDLGDNGTLDYNEVSPGTAAPAIAADHIRLAKVSTDGSDITGVTLYRNPAYLEKADGWNRLNATLSVASGYNQGNKSFVLDTSTDLTDILSPGMRLKLDRSIAAPTQCTDLESSSSQYATKSSPSGISFTDDATYEAWIKLESYTGSIQHIINRRDGNTAGWGMQISSAGQLQAVSLRIASNNRTLSTYQSVPLGRWVHVAVTTDNSANSHAMYIDGVSVPFSNSTNGTITALVQPSQDLRLGALSSSASEYFDGKIADVRVWSAVRTATQIQDNMNQQLVGNETNLVGYWKLNGNFNDSHASANHLTASGGAAATSVDNPFSDTEFAIITKVDASEITVFTGTDHSIPNTTLLLPNFSSERAPFGFPASKSKWYVEQLRRTQSTQGSATNSQWYNLGNAQLSVPVGEWRAIYMVQAGTVPGSAGNTNVMTTLSTSSSSETHREWSASHNNASSSQLLTNLVRDGFLSLDAQTTYYLNTAYTVATGTTTIYNQNQETSQVIRAECAYL